MALKFMMTGLVIIASWLSEFFSSFGQQFLEVAIDAKTQYVSVCNATETFLVNEALKDSFLPEFIKTMQGLPMR